MTGYAAVTAQEIKPEQGGRGRELPKTPPRPEKEYQAIGILYAKRKDGIVEFLAVFEGHIHQEIQDELAARFGVGAFKWLER